MLFELMRVGLAACHDFSFMAKSASAVFVVVFTPVIIYARFVAHSARAYYIAMYAPHFAMILVFGWRYVVCSADTHDV
jgi:hypothetical protein